MGRNGPLPWQYDTREQGYVRICPGHNWTRRGITADGSHVYRCKDCGFALTWPAHMIAPVGLFAGEPATLKRIAWAYGCAKKGSAEEGRLLVLLLEKAKATIAIGGRA